MPVPKYACTVLEHRSPWLLAWSCLLLSCTTTTTPPVDKPPMPTPQLPAVQPAPESSETSLYGPREALDDVLSSELRFLGTGPWPGLERSHACVFGNDRVLVVHIYCSRTERHAFRLDIYSPTRGRLSLYAEAEGTFSTARRADYFTFTAESAEPAPPGVRGTVDPSMSFGDLSAYEQQRHGAMPPMCYAGIQHREPVGGCVGGLDGGDWSAASAPFFADPGQDWYRVVTAMRSMATRYGVDSF